MTTIGTIESLWRYPVKGMAGEMLPEAFVGYAGIYGDRIFGFGNPAGPKGFPFLTARDREQMVTYRPRFRDAGLALRPPNQAEAEQLGPGVTPVYPSLDELIVDVETPSGQVLAVDDPALHAMLAPKADAALSLLRSHRAMTDCRPVSLISLHTINQIAEETGIEPDRRRFRANLYVNLESGRGFGEDGLVGHRLRIGSRAVVAVLELDPRCKLITIDPVTAAANPDIYRKLMRGHDGNAGVYCAVITEGVVRPEDSIVLLD